MPQKPSIQWDLGPDVDNLSQSGFQSHPPSASSNTQIVTRNFSRALLGRYLHQWFRKLYRWSLRWKTKQSRSGKGHNTSRRPPWRMMLRTWAMEFCVRNSWDEAAEHGPRYEDGGRTRETGSWGALDVWLLPLSVMRWWLWLKPLLVFSPPFPLLDHDNKKCPCSTTIGISDFIAKYINRAQKQLKL